MMAEGLGTCAKAGWLCAARSRWRLTAGERFSLGTYLAYPFGAAAHIPTRPLNGQETAGGGCQNGRSSQIRRCCVRCVTAGTLLAAAEGFAGRCLALHLLSMCEGRGCSPRPDQPAVNLRAAGPKG